MNRLQLNEILACFRQEVSSSLSFLWGLRLIILFLCFFIFHCSVWKGIPNTQEVQCFINISNFFQKAPGPYAYKPFPAFSLSIICKLVLFLHVNETHSHMKCFAPRPHLEKEAEDISEMVYFYGTETYRSEGH